MDEQTVALYKALRDAAFWAWRGTRDYTPEDQQARDAYFEARNLHELAIRTYKAANPRGEPNG